MRNINKIHCLAVDDEPPALDVLKHYIASVSALELAGTCNNALDALSFLQDRSIDLLFLDIQMPQLLGTDLIRTLKNPPKVIFTTAFRKFALEGFELDAVDYLLKPISFERFLKAVNKVMNTSIIVPPVRLNNTTVIPKSDPFICFRAERKMVKINFDEILFIESLRDYVRVVTASKALLTKQSISSLEETLPKELFIRIHRSFIIALNKIDSYTSDTVEIGKAKLPVSRMYKLAVEQVLGANH